MRVRPTRHPIPHLASCLVLLKFEGANFCRRWRCYVGLCSPAPAVVVRQIAQVQLLLLVCWRRLLFWFLLVLWILLLLLQKMILLLLLLLVVKREL